MILGSPPVQRRNLRQYPPCSGVSHLPHVKVIANLRRVSNAQPAFWRQRL